MFSFSLKAIGATKLSKWTVGHRIKRNTRSIKF